MKCAVVSKAYRVFGYGGKQVRDNIHCADLVRRLCRFFAAPRCGEAYNIGGSRFSNCSMIEAISLCEEISGKRMETTYIESNRIGDHIWWISDVRKFQEHYPGWRVTRNVEDILREICDRNAERWIDEMNERKSGAREPGSWPRGRPVHRRSSPAPGAAVHRPPVDLDQRAGRVGLVGLGLERAARVGRPGLQAAVIGPSHADAIEESRAVPRAEEDHCLTFVDGIGKEPDV